ncbi:MAG: RpiB/LacA/LacB family sugar-phosphate isomerase [Salinivirgaceae bacterium]|jgi:ribose 5-phosphate isomerase B|nr:RpiB/LacA/LacB family sugar-phosphate isomerase [Salinivirgaceae bacterium]
MKRKILLTSDHAAYPLKNHLKYWLEKQDYDVTDLGTDSEDSTSYAIYGHKLGDLMDSESGYTGIALCGSGNGMNMSVGKHKSTRNALCWNSEISRLARLHNNANVCVLPGRYITQVEAEKIVEIFLNTDFEGGRHQGRVNMIPLNH